MSATSPGDAPDLVALLGDDRRLAHLNPAGLALLGLAGDIDVAALRLDGFVTAPTLDEVVAAAARDRVWAGELTLRVGGTELGAFGMCAALGGEPARFALVARPGAAAAEAARLRGLVDDLAVVVWEADARTGEFTFVSAHAGALLGHPPARWLGDPGFRDEITHPDDRAETARLRGRLMAERDDYELSHRAVTADGRVLWVQETAHVARDADGAPLRAHGVLIDISERRAAEGRERFLGALERSLQPLEDPAEIMRVATRLLGEHIGADRCAYAEAEADEDHFLMSGDHATGLPPLPGRFAMRAFGEDALRAMRAGEPWVVVDSLDDARLTGSDLDAYRVTGIRAVICVPLLKGGRFAAAMAVHQAVPRRWTAAEIDLVEVVVNRCWESIQRTHADRALRAGEQRYRLLVELATDGIWIVDRDLRFVEVNPAACALLGHDRDELLGRPATDLVVSRPGSDLGAAAADGVVTEVWDVRRADGSVLSLELGIQATPTGFQAIGRDVTARLRVERERELLLLREHEIAQALQRSLLPRELPELERLAAAARYLPASAHAQAGGDWYEVLPISDTAAALSVGDVVGKGPTAAAVMGQLRSALAGYLLDGHSPAAALERLDAFTRRTPGAAGSTCACLVLDWEAGTLRWALAGHPPPLLVDAGQPRLLDGGAGAVLGAPDREPYREGVADLGPGASVVLYTDGLVERRGVMIDDGLDRLLALAGEARDLEPDAFTSAITDAFLAEGHDDDVALVVVRHIPEPLRELLPAAPSELGPLRRRVAAWAARAGLPADLVGGVQLALGEAAANAVEHAYPAGGGDFDYEVARVAGGGVRVRVGDRGRWRPEPADNGHRGRGLGIIRALSERVDFQQGDRGTTVEFVIAPSPTPAGGPGAVGAPAAEHPGLSADGDGRTVVLRLTGDLDLTGAEDLRAPLLARVEAADPRPVDVDLTALGYLSSSGVALLLEVAAAAARAGRALSVVTAAGTPPTRILELSGLTGGGSPAVRVVDRRP